MLFFCILSSRTFELLDSIFDLLELFCCRARNRNIDAAAEMYKNTMAWRSSYSIQELMDAFGTEGHYATDGGRVTDPIDWTWVPHPNTLEAELAYRHAFFTRLPAEISPEPVLIWRAGHADYQGIVREDLVDIMIKAFIVHLEVSRLPTR